MTVEDFEYLLEIVGPRIAKKDTNMRQSILASERLCVTLRFLGTGKKNSIKCKFERNVYFLSTTKVKHFVTKTGDSYHSLMYLFRIPVFTIARIVPECCSVLFDVLKNKYLKVSISTSVYIHSVKKVSEHLLVHPNYER